LFLKESYPELKRKIRQNDIGKKGLEEIEEMNKYLNSVKLKNIVKFDPTLARGLNYYTGIVFEVNAEDTGMGSLGGGGRYDDLTGIFGLKDMPGTGISFGAERIFDVMAEKGLFPDSLTAGPHVLIVAFDKPAHLEGFRLLSVLRQAGVRADMYPEPAKMKKQMKYADTIGVKYTVLIGSDELNNNYYTLKYMDGSKANVRLSIEDLLEEVRG
jgi:histidyl-tRNA synthetase